jgi:hypothetical protein
MGFFFPPFLLQRQTSVGPSERLIVDKNGAFADNNLCIKQNLCSLGMVMFQVLIVYHQEKVSYA